MWPRRGPGAMTLPVQLAAVRQWRLHMLCAAIVALAGAAVPASAQRQAASSPPPLRQWVLQTGDNERAPFIIIDKRLARMWLFTAAGQPLGDSPVLLGRAQGDSSVAGIGERDMKDILPHERTTPAGRFVAEAGHNEGGEDIFWLDYDAAVSMHRVRATNAVERRLQRLASSTPADNRISYGCINVPAKFYDQHIRPAFDGRRGVVYVLPETVPAGVLFKSLKGMPGAP